MIRITGPIDQMILDEKIRFSHKSKKVETIKPINPIQKSFNNQNQNSKQQKEEQSSDFEKVFKKNKIT